jgi:undecaprenyl-diphosphatase
MSTDSFFYDWFGFNESLFSLINGIHSPALDQMMVLITSLGHPQLYPFYIMFALVLMWYKPALMPQRNVVTFSVSYILTSAIIVPLLKTSLNFPRPVTVLGEQSVTILGSPDVIHSFPSGHSAYAVLMAVSLAPSLPPAGKIALFTFTFLVCLSRIFVGAHFPADVIGGVLLALTIVVSVKFILGSDKQVTPTDLYAMNRFGNTNE